MKVLKLMFFIVVIGLLISVIYVFEINNWPVGNTLAGILFGWIGPKLRDSINDLRDTTAWEISQRKLERGTFIDKDTIIRISFAYLYRIKINGKYFLIRNKRGTEKYQPVGGVYKFSSEERKVLKSRYHVMDDNKVPIDESSRDDYRLRVKNRYLREFVGRFDGDAIRERIDNIGREFKEELIDKGILNWKTITYRICGRHMTEVQFSRHFQIYELLLADVVELLPDNEQMEDLCHLMENDSYRFVTAEEIKSLGIQANSANFLESISDHTFKILEEEESDLMWIPNAKKEYTISL